MTMQPESLVKETMITIAAEHVLAAPPGEKYQALATALAEEYGYQVTTQVDSISAVDPDGVYWTGTGPELAAWLADPRPAEFTIEFTADAA
jgi:hypothetical protein